MSQITSIPLQMNAYCKKCEGERLCKLFGEAKEGYFEKNYDWFRTWYLLQCMGCEYIFVYADSFDSESYKIIPNERGIGVKSYNHTHEYWPALSKRDRPKWFLNNRISLPHKPLSNFPFDGFSRLNSTLEEVYTALDHDICILATIGIRTVFDVISEILGIDTNLSFQDKLDQLLIKSHIESSKKTYLEILVDAGNATAHRGWRPQPQELETLMELLESFIYETFIEPENRKHLEEKLKEVSARIPARKSARMKK